MTKIFESPNEGATVYYREFGQQHRTLLVGCVNSDDPVDSRTSDGRPLYDHIQDSKLWGNIRREANTNPALQEALDRAKIIYYLSKENGNSKKTP